MRYSHFAHVPDPGQYRRILTPAQAQRVVDMKQRGMTFGAIAHWFTRNGTPISYQAVRAAYERATEQEAA